MCRQGTGWDDPLPEHLRPRWEHWRKDLVNLEKIQIARCYVPANFGEVVKRELHHFSDASTTGYGQCSYLRVKNEDGNVHCALIMGKSRVSPTKATTALPPPGKFVREDLYGQKRWRQVQYLAEQFWSRWRKEYLHDITVRQRWHTPKRILLHFCRWKRKSPATQSPPSMLFALWSHAVTKGI